MFIIGNVVTINGSTTFEKSIGPALRVSYSSKIPYIDLITHTMMSQILGTLVVLQGDILFKENTHHPEGFSGALYLSSFGQIILYPSTNITFLNNNGRSVQCYVSCMRHVCNM